jgi:flagellar motor switch protein FliN/FliY
MGTLSQEEINALLNDSFKGKDSRVGGKELLNSFERDALGEVSNISMGAAATTLSALLGKRVEITTPNVSEKSINGLVESYPDSYVIVDVNYRKGLQGSNVLIIHSCDASVIVDLMMGGDGTEPPKELSDLHYSAVSEAMNQMMGSSCTALSQILQRRVDITPPSITMLGLAKHHSFSNIEETMVQISFRIVIQNLIDSEMIQVMTIGFAKEIVEDLVKKNELGDYQPKPDTQEAHANKASIHPATVQQKEDQAANGEQGQIAVAPVYLGQFAPEEAQNGTRPNLDLILDVGLQLSVELGRTNKRIKEILELSVGAILELDKLAGEPVDILINGKMLAQGEVVVIDENFGVRVTEIVSQIERVKKLK